MAVKLASRFCPGFARFAVQTKRFDKKNTIQSNCFTCCPCKYIQDFKCINEYPKEVVEESKFSSYWPGKIVHGSECYSIARRKLSQKSDWINNIPKNSNHMEHLSSYERNSTNLFRHLDPSKRRSYEYPDLLQGSNNTLDYLRGLPRNFFFRRQKKDDGKKKPKRRIPKLILLQNPFTWLMTKIDFGILRRIWDPSFSEKDFKFGTKQAIAKVTNVISAGQYTELNGLLTKAARLSLMRELDRNWSDKQRSLLSLNRDDIQISTPRKVYFIKIADKKYCDVDMAFLALKWAPINSIEALIFTEIFARFHREYTPHSIPEWTIAYFKVTRFEVLRRKPRSLS